MCVVLFDAAEFKGQYPAFVDVPDPVLVSYFGQATLYLNNTECSPVRDCTERKILLYMLVAHIATLAARPGGMVGRISSATEGTISVSAEMPNNRNAAWFLQTPWGASFYQATARYRTMRYVPGRSWPATGYGAPRWLLRR